MSGGGGVQDKDADSRVVHCDVDSVNLDFLINFLSTGRSEHHSIDPLKEREVEKGGGGRSAVGGR